jgi:hypothetical protein
MKGITESLCIVTGSNPIRVKFFTAFSCTHVNTIIIVFFWEKPNLIEIRSVAPEIIIYNCYMIQFSIWCIFYQAKRIGFVSGGGANREALGETD